MEAIEEPAVHSAADDVKVNTVSDETGPMTVEVDVCHKSNGVVESADSDCAVLEESARPETLENVEIVQKIESALADSSIEDVITTSEPVAPISTEPDTTDAELLAVISETASAVENLLGDDNPSQGTEEITEEIVEHHEDIVSHENDIAMHENDIAMHENDIAMQEPPAEVGDVQANDKVTFETEILIEKNDGSPNQNDIIPDEHDNTNNLLNDLDQGIELSEALRSSDATDNVENNNSTSQDEVFNKEELLDILEGNDSPTSSAVITKNLEAQIAMKQLTRLKSTRNNKNKRSNEPKIKSVERPSRKKKVKEISPNTSDLNTTLMRENSQVEDKTLDEITNIIEENTEIGENKSESIVNDLVQDWEDDEPLEMEEPGKVLDDNESLTKACDELEKSLEMVAKQVEVVTETSSDPKTDENQTINSKKRLIKKKVIFDPDNPDTFTKGKTLPKKVIPDPNNTDSPVKSKVVSKSKEPLSEKEQPQPKKIKAEQTTPRSKSKSPMSKMQWKKPPPKNSNIKHNRRLTEVDKLLMDEGAVNMIYQLTPEATKGKKNMKTKAEFIKKLQSSTPEGKEMKFRERKKDIKSEENEAKRILGGKQRSSLSSSVKSPSVCEDFETHSADDSIIYRRHSSSSYSSACMSPRRLSDVDPAAMPGSTRAAHAANERQSQLVADTDQAADVFMADGDTTIEIINKDDCLSLKEKLNTKLSLALNKRKRDSTKGDKPPKQKRVSRAEAKIEVVKDEYVISFKYISVSFDSRLAEICIGKTGSSIQVLKEIEQAMVFVDNSANIAVTLLTSECGMLCSDLDLCSLLDGNMEKRTKYAFEIAEAARSLLSTAERHSKLLVCGVWGACADVAVALAALSDVTLASERSSFALSAAPPMPGAAALAARTSLMPPTLVNELVVFGRRLSAAEAQQSGLVTRTLWPDRAEAQVRDIARDLAAPPTHSILLKKQLLNLKKGDACETFLASLEKERDLLVHYWTSAEGQAQLRAVLHDA